MTYLWLWSRDVDQAHPNVKWKPGMANQTIPPEAEFTLLKKDMRRNKIRSGVRYRCALATLGHVLFPDSGESQNAWVFNMSRKGIGLNLGRALEPETPLVIKLKSPVNEKFIKVPARVIHATPEADGTWRIGCELLEHLTPELLDELL
jgi:PilZ domain-containing protein